MTDPVGQVVPVSEFGPFDLLAEWAHQRYLEGYHLEAVHAARCALALVDLTNDAITGYYLRYSMSVAMHELGMHRECVVEAQRLLARVDSVRLPYWRAKGLSVLAEAVMSEGEMNSAMDALAEGSHLLGSNPSQDYNQMSASMAVALAMRAMYLFEESDALLMASLRDDSYDLIVLDEATQTLLFWGAMRELSGEAAEARLLYVRAASRARRIARLAERVGDTVMPARLVAYEAFVLERLGEFELAEHLLREWLFTSTLRDELVDGHVARLTLARVVARRGEHAQAREHLEVVARAAEHAGRDVWGMTAVAALAEVDEMELAPHPGVARMRILSERILLRLWQDRESRFSGIQSRIRVRELLEQAERMGQVALEDPLTGLGNRRRLLQYISTMQGSVSAFFVDLDRFKDVNDTYGHETGDAVLQAVGSVLSTLCRADDVVVRYGGDEFIVLIDADPGAVTTVAQRVHEAVRQMDWDLLADGLRVTVSIGVATAVSVQDVLAAADTALYAAKNRGRDQVVAV